MAGPTPPNGEKVGIVVVHGVGETEPGWINDALVARLERDTTDSTFRLADHSEVYAIPDLGRTSRKPFPSHVRRLRSRQGADVTLAELFWADLSRIDSGRLGYPFALLMVLFEAPLVLVRSLQPKSPSLIHRFIRGLLLTATWLIRWPIAGLTIALLYSGIVCIALAMFNDWKEWPHDTLPVALVLLASLPPLIVGSLLIARANVHRYIGATDLALSTAICGTLFLLFVLAQPFVLPDVPHVRPVDYFLSAFPALEFCWGLWFGSVLLALVLLLIMELFRLIWRGRARPSQTRLRRSWVALAIVIAQEIVWRLIVSPTSILVVNLLEPCLLGKTDCPGLKSQRDPLLKAMIGWSNSFLHCLYAVLLVAATGLIVKMLRESLAGRERKGKIPDAARAWIPRLILSPTITAALVIGLIIQIGAAGPAALLLENLGLTNPGTASADNVRLTPAELVLTTTGLWLTFAFLFALRNLGSSMHGALHIARELIDHQYTPKFGVASYLLPVKKRAHRVADYPRRRRILMRLESLVDDFAQREQYKRIVFVGHSQGTVIIQDYLRSAAAARALDKVPEVHVLSLGSPITHLYQHYFQEYGVQATQPSGLHKSVRSWTNMWRRDDPIGSLIEMKTAGPLGNIELPRGGHTDYWREVDVRQMMMRLVRGEPPKSSMPPRPDSPGQPPPPKPGRQGLAARAKLS